MKRSHRLALAVTLTLAIGACVDDVADPITGPSFGVVGDHSPPPSDPGLYTQNMWLGGDTEPLFSLPFGDLSSPDPIVRGQALNQIIETTNGFFAEVQASDIPARTAEIAAEIEARRPNVVALQEAVSYATGTLDLATFEFTPTAPGPSLLGSLMAEVGPLGYSIAVMQPTTSIALPTGPPDPNGLSPALGVQDMLVMLVRDGMEVADRASGLYMAALPIGPTSILRGWVRVTMVHDGMPYHFVSTHLETQGSSDPSDPVGFGIRQVHNAQAAEIQEIIASLDGNAVLMGDLNSDANGDPSKRSWTPTYGNLLDAGFIDVWANAPHRGDDEGVTCCFEPGRTPDERIDFVLVRPDALLIDHDQGKHRGFYRADIVGDEVSDQTAGGLWPSDHAGIMVTVGDPRSRRGQRH